MMCKKTEKGHQMVEAAFVESGGSSASSSRKEIRSGCLSSLPTTTNTDETRLDYISIPPIVTPHVTPHSPSSHTLDSNSECSD